MAETLKLDTYAELLLSARSAFSDDPAYAIDAARQARIVRARRTPTASRAESNPAKDPVYA